MCPTAASEAVRFVWVSMFDLLNKNKYLEPDKSADDIRLSHTDVAFLFRLKSIDIYLRLRTRSPNSDESQL